MSVVPVSVTVSVVPVSVTVSVVPVSVTVSIAVSVTVSAVTWICNVVTYTVATYTIAAVGVA